MPDEAPILVPESSGKPLKKDIILDASTLPMDSGEKPKSDKKSVPGEMYTDALTNGALKPSGITSDSVDLVEQTIDFIHKQKPLKGMQEELSPILSDLAAKTDIVNSILVSHQLERLGLYLKMRWKLEKALSDAMMKDELTVAEMMSLRDSSVEECDKIQKFLQNFTSPLSSVEDALEKADRALSDNDKRVKTELEGTRTHGRDLVAKLAHKAKKVTGQLVDAQKSQHK